MSLLPQPIQLTDIQKSLKDIQSISESLKQIVLVSFRRASQLVWDNEKVTPQQMFDAVGADSVLFCQISSKLMELLAVVGVTVESPVPANKDLQFNQDGTVTVIDKV
jgi:hypothetical protein